MEYFESQKIATDFSASVSDCAIISACLKAFS